MGNGPVGSVIIQPDGTFQLPVLPGTTFVYFSIAPDSMRQRTKLWDVLDHPNPLTATQHPIESDRSQEVEVNFPVKVNKEELGQVMQGLQGDREIQSGTSVAGGNVRMALTADRLLDGERRSLRFLAKYRLRGADDYCFSPAEATEQRLSNRQFCNCAITIPLTSHTSVSSRCIGCISKFPHVEDALRRCRLPTEVRLPTARSPHVTRSVEGVRCISLVLVFRMQTCLLLAL